MSIKLRLVLSFLTTIIPTIFAVVLGFNNAQEALKQTRLEGLETIAELKVQGIESILRRYEAEIRIVKDHPNVRNSVLDLDKLVIADMAKEDERLDSDLKLAREMVRGQVRALAKRNSDVINVIIVNNAGQVFFTLNETSFLFPGVDLPEYLEEIYTKGKAGFYIRDRVLLIGEQERTELAISAPIMSEDSELLATIIVEMGLGAISTLLNDYTGLGATGESSIGRKEKDHAIFLAPLRHDRDIALLRRISFGQGLALPLQEVVQGKEGAGISLDYRLEEVVSAWRYIPSLDWGLVTKIDTRDAFASLRSVKKLLTVLTGMILLILLIMGLSLARSISAPIEALQEGVKIIGEGDLDYKVDTGSSDEFGEFSRAFDLMRENLLETKNDLLQQSEDLVKANEELRVSHEKMLQNERLAALGMIGAGVAHELNNPMMGIVNQIQYSIAKTPEDSAVHEVLSEALFNVRRCIKIVEDLLTYSRTDLATEAGPDREGDLAAVSRQVLQSTRPALANAGIAIVDRIGEDPAMVKMEESKIAQVLLNLVYNARDAMAGREKCVITVELESTDELVSVIIGDTGTGIDAEGLHRVFEPFYTTKAPGSGTGLGLYLCKNIIEIAGGRIDVSSELGVGTTFSVSLPRVGSEV